MWIKSLQIKNVKGFSNTGVINFSDGINVVIGANRGKGRS
jgi:chromosome segregation ATPase